MSGEQSGTGGPVYGPRYSRDRGYSNNYARNIMAKVASPKAWVKTNLSEAPTEPPKMLVDGMIPAGMVGSIHAAGGEGKTLAAVYLAEQAMLRGFRVAFLDKENGARIMRERFEMMGANLPALERDGLIAFYDHPAAGRDPETVAGYVAMLEAEKPDLLIIDAWVGFLGSCGFEENSATDIAAWADLYTTPARSRGVAVLLLDHTPKDSTNKTARGSSRKRDYVDYQFELEKAGVIDRENTGIITLKLKKDRAAWLKNVHQFRVGGAAEGFVFEPIDAPHDLVGNTSAGGEKATLETLEEGMTYAEWREASGKADTTFNRHREKLNQVGLVVKRDERWYRTGGDNRQPEDERPPRPDNAHGRGGRSGQDRTSNAHHAHHPKGGRVGVPDGDESEDEGFASFGQGETPPQVSEGQNGLVGVPGPDNPSLADCGSTSGVAEGRNDVVGSGVSDEAERRIRRLVEEDNWSLYAARAEVLAKDHPLSCECAVCA